MQVPDFVADLIGDLGARIVRSQIAVGNVFFDRIAELVVDYAANRGIGILKSYFRQKHGSYYDIRTGELFATKALEKYDVEFE